MAKSRNDILFRFLGDTKSLDRASKKARGDFKDTDRAAGKLRTGMGNLQTAFVAAGGAFAIKEAGQFILDVTQMAESARLAGESAEKVLGPALAGLRDRLDETRLRLGFNSGEMDTLFAKLGLLTEGFGLTDDAQAEFIENLVVTAGDLAAFNGRVGESEGAIDAMTAAIRGEFDPLEQWGVKLKQSEINERALEIQARDTTGEITDQEAQIAAITELINEKAAPAIGALSDAEDTLGVKTNEATAKLGDLKIQLGDKLTPVVITAATEMLDLVEGITFLADESVPTTTRLKELGKALGEVAVWVQAVIGWLNPLGLAFNGAKLFVDRFFDSIEDVLGSLRDLTTFKLPKFSFPKLPSAGSLFGFARGGTVGGPKGAAQLAVVHGGEQVLTPQQQSADNVVGGVTIVNVEFSGVVGDPAEVAQQIKDLLEFGDRVDGVG